MGILGQITSIFTKGPAIQNLENFDMVVTMKDGGLLLVIICSKHLDGSEETLNLLRSKVENYVQMTEMNSFKQDFPNPEYLQIELACIKRPDPEILNEIERLKQKYASLGIGFSWRK